MERLLREALPRIEGNEEIKEYLEKSAEWGNPAIYHWRLLHPVTLVLAKGCGFF